MKQQATALLIVDMISCWDFLDSEKLLPGALAITPALARLKARCVRAGVPVIYANDNLGRWRSDFRTLIDESLACGGGAAEITTALHPQPSDYFVLKPKHSAFFCTPMELLLAHLNVDRLVVVGVASDQCVMTTVAEARMRDFDVVVPEDCVASQSSARNAAALRQFRESHTLKTTHSSRLRLT
ncbi:cysteine hydrolase family protein [Variovorax ginsengisoli]|uniref:Nicotinamidase-related amidase n=1 Tax=Variovorax ginsengisoli TaxID=363844 RepID=A0ABT9SE48_9BURK|nr:isochorismatase family cysteine hydrolase [Variovorax ginsengisoli]MDP9902480.1 nicotinamidase-related amidase [Variovorax ginsengisoli]